MRKAILAATLALVVAMATAPGAARGDGPLGLSASPNPAIVGQSVTFGVSISQSVGARLEMWVSARGFDRPTLGSLPLGGWSYQCCTAEVSPAWYYRSYANAPAGLYRFAATARARGTHPAVARLGAYRASVSIQVV